MNKDEDYPWSSITNYDGEKGLITIELFVLAWNKSATLFAGRTRLAPGVRVLTLANVKLTRFFAS